MDRYQVLGDNVNSNVGGLYDINNTDMENKIDRQLLKLETFSNLMERLKFRYSDEIVVNYDDFAKYVRECFIDVLTEDMIPDYKSSSPDNEVRNFVDSYVEKDFLPYLVKCLHENCYKKELYLFIELFLKTDLSIKTLCSTFKEKIYCKDTFPKEFLNKILKGFKISEIDTYIYKDLLSLVKNGLSCRTDMLCKTLYTLIVLESKKFSYQPSNSDSNLSVKCTFHKAIYQLLFEPFTEQEYKNIISNIVNEYLSLKRFNLDETINLIGLFVVFHER